MVVRILSLRWAGVLDARLPIEALAAEVAPRTWNTRSFPWSGEEQTRLTGGDDPLQGRQLLAKDSDSGGSMAAGEWGRGALLLGWLTIYMDGFNSFWSCIGEGSHET
jgi:hypothetical protein